MRRPATTIQEIVMRHSLLPLAAAAALVTSSGAQAQVYVGGNAGWSRLSVDCADTASCDKTGTGYKAYVGYRWGSGFAVEGLYIDWGKAKAQVAGEELIPVDPEQPTLLRRTAVEGSPTYDPINVDLNGSGWGLGVAYFLDFTPQFNGVARLGAINNTGKLSTSGGMGSGSFSEDSIQAYFGFGVAYNVTPNFAVTAEADFSRLKYDTDGVTDTSNLQLYTFGLRYSF